MPLNMPEGGVILEFLGYLHVRMSETLEERQDPASSNQRRSRTACFEQHNPA